MKNAIKWLGIIAFFVVIGILVIGCGDNNGGTTGGIPQSSVRYETIPFGSAGFGRTTAADDPFVLISSVKAHDDSAWYYLYYIGYINSVPVAYKTSYRYDGVTPITIMFEKTWATEETITESMIKAKDETWDVNASVTTGVEVGVKSGFMPFLQASVKASVSTTIGGSYGQTISTSNTWETSISRINGETESITATIGEHGQPAGRYRYALMGIIDVFCLVKVNPTTRAVMSYDIINCARESSYAWGIDFEVDDTGYFGKTGGGKNFDVPNVDFSNVAAPTDTLAAPPQPCPPGCNCNGTGNCGHFPCLCQPAQTERDTGTFFTITRQIKNRAENVNNPYNNNKGDNDVNSRDGRTTNWELRVTGMELRNNRGDGTFSDVDVTFEYWVMEGQSDWTTLKLTHTERFSFGTRRIISLNQPTTGTRQGTVEGRRHDWIDNLGNWNDGLIRKVGGQIDSSSTNDLEHIGFNAELYIQFKEKLLN